MIPTINHFYESFVLGIAGAFTVYLCNFRKTRLEAFLTVESKKAGMIKFLIWDCITFVIGGGLATMLFLYPEDYKEAALCGASWQGIVGGLAAGIQRDIESKGKAIEKLIQGNPEANQELEERLKELEEES